MPSQCRLPFFQFFSRFFFCQLFISVTKVIHTYYTMWSSSGSKLISQIVKEKMYNVGCNLFHCDEVNFVTSCVKRWCSHFQFLISYIFRFVFFKTQSYLASFEWGVYLYADIVQAKLVRYTKTFALETLCSNVQNGVGFHLKHLKANQVNWQKTKVRWMNKIFPV